MPENSCLVSIIIPVRNEERYIGKCLDSILASDFPPDAYEVIVVDGDSRDRSRDIVRERQLENPRLQLLLNLDRIVPVALNMGIRRAQGKYVIRMDAHAEYPSDYIKNCVEELERTGADNVGGRLITKPGNDSIGAKAIAYLTQNPIAVGNSKFRTGGGGEYVDTVPFGAYRRDVFEWIGLFREDLVRHQDFEFNARLRHAGGKIFLSSRIYNTYYNVPSFTSFMRQAYLNGIWCARAWSRYPVSFCPRHAAPLAFVCWLLVTSLLGVVLKPILLAGVVTFILYAAASVVVGLQTAWRHGWAYLFVVPAFITSYHLIYGASTVAGFFEVAVDKLPFFRRRAVAFTAE